MPAHSVFAVYGVRIEAAPDAREALEHAVEALNISAREAGNVDPPLGLFAVGGESEWDHVLLGVAHQSLGIGSCTALPAFPADPRWDSILRSAAERLGLQVPSGPCGFIAHDLS
ncbi:hypothetical protein GCM10010358_68210 [Streptomyces minutiscleroticus]|uniref:Uncharacterized protein n=1 Tax=Streptomyces minutiscleroticus TaxID=68238 RepID=A0A918U7M4_9ACTN|nr:hypothetical protein [Streptomyces minutiscleroticus]GGY05175.1 hypothetical protein GCM10010358_68210 [Streptomyces minutiscleroticus]